MNFNNFTIKSQEVVQKAQQLTQELEQQQIENAHLFKAILEVDKNVTPFILKKLELNTAVFSQVLDTTIQSYPKVSGGTLTLSKTTNTTLIEAGKLAKKMKIEIGNWFIESPPKYKLDQSIIHSYKTGHWVSRRIINIPSYFTLEKKEILKLKKLIFHISLIENN